MPTGRTCAFKLRPRPCGRRPVTCSRIEGFYLDYDEELTVVLADRLADAGFRHTGSEFDTYSVAKLGHFYSAAMILFTPGDGQPYSEAAERFRVLDLTIGQN